MRLRDGTIVPAEFGVNDSSRAPAGPAGFFDEVAVLVGEVTDIFYRDDPGNVSKKFTEYTVMVWRRNGAGPQERIAFHCSQSDGHGSIADFVRFSYRTSSSKPNQKPLANGATVFVACVNGDRSNAYIIGAMPQPNRTEGDPTRSEGRYHQSRFNGVEMTIKDDGSFELKVPGATDVNGKPDNRDPDNHGSLLRFEKNGNIVIDDQNGEQVVVNPASRTIDISASEEVDVGAKNVTIGADRDLDERADRVTVTADRAWTLKAPKVVVKSSDVNIGGDNLNPLQHGVVQGSCIDMLTGLPFGLLKDTSLTVKAQE